MITPKDLYPKGRVRWLANGQWSAWYDLGSAIPEALKQLEITALQTEEYMNKAEYEELIKGATDVKSTDKGTGTASS